jgi:hypothetical protein
MSLDLDLFYPYSGNDAQGVTLMTLKCYPSLKSKAFPYAIFARVYHLVRPFPVRLPERSPNA